MQQYYQRWQSLSQRPEARHWTPEGLLPDTLTDDERALAQHEIKSLPEQFYTTHSWLPVITPSLYKHFEAATFQHKPSIALWTICSGSSRLSLQMSELPFLQAVLFPVDLRYGWNLLDKDHQQLLQRANKHYKPHTTTFELRSRNWNRTSKYDSEADQKRQQETPMLQFVARHSIYLTEHQQNVIIEGPFRSIMWTCSPLQALKDHPNFKLNNIHV